MSRTFKIPRAPYNKGDNIYNKATFTFEPGVTVLVGCNGSGKTTLLRHIKEKVEQDNELLCLYFNNLADGGQNSTRRYLWSNHPELAASMITGSEGEGIVTNVGVVAGNIGNLVRENQSNNKALFLLFDAIDSGLSVNNIVDIKEYLFKTILEDNAGKRDVYIICSSNEYELCNGEQCFDVQNARYLTFKSYDEYKHFILKSAAVKNKRFETEDQLS